MLEGPYSKVDESDSGRAIQALVDQALEREDIEEACRLVDTYVASPKVAKAKNLFAVGHVQVKVVRALASQGDYERARNRAEAIEDGTARATAFAELGVAIWSEEGAIAAEKDLKKAGAIAKIVGILARCRVAEALHRGGFERAAGAIAWDALVELIQLEKGSRREMYAGFLAQTFLKLEHEGLIATFESELNEKDGVEFLIGLAGLYAKQRNQEGLFEILSAFQKMDAKSGTTFDYTRAAREALLKLKDRKSGDRFAAELARAIVKHARSQPADMRAWLLASLLDYDACVPVEPSSYHPWSVPPTLAGDWTTPEDAGAAAAMLQSALGDFPMPQVRAIRKRALRFDPETDLYEFDGFRGGLRYHYVLLKSGEDVRLLDGTKEILDPVAQRAKWQDSDEALFDLVHLLISTRSGQGGRFRVIEDPSVLEELREPRAQLPKLELEGTRLVERTKAGATLEADMLIHRRLERIEIKVHDSGQVSITNREILAEDLPVELEYYIGGCFERRLIDLEEIWPLYKTDEVAWACGMAELFALGFGEGGWRVDPSLAFYFLGIAKEKGHPNPIQLIGRAWRDGKGVTADPAEAIEWFVAAASRGNLDACCEAADLLLASPSPERRDRARTVLNFGKERGHEGCAQKLNALDAASQKK